MDKMKEDIQALSEFLKNMAFLRLTSDFAFKAYFVNNKNLLKSLLKHFLPLPKDASIVEIDLLNPQLIPDQSSGKPDKTFILDLRAKFIRESSSKRETEIINIEVQTTKQAHFTDRILAYSGRLYSEQLKAGEEYKLLAPVYSLVFTTQNLPEFKDVKDDYRHVCNIRRIKEPQVIMSRGMCFIIIELGKFTKDMEKLDSMRDEWCFILKNSETLGIKECQKFLNKGGEMAKALKHLWNISQDDQLREIEWAQEKQRKDRFAEKEFARQEGLEEGHEVGRVEGREVGRVEGREMGHIEGRVAGRVAGRVEGRKEEQKKFALSMLHDGFNTEVICKHTGLTEEEIENLKDSKKS